MNVKISSLAEQTAKCIFIAAVLASFVFFGWRVVTKRAYVEHERAQCEALAVSAALTAAEAVSKDEALAKLVRELGEAEFVTDHMSMPGNNTASVTIGAEQGGFLIRSKAASGWNSRSPQSIEFELRLQPGGEITYKNENDIKRASRIRAARANISNKDPLKEHLFTFPHERPCPAPFTALTAKVSGFSDKTVYILILNE
ncbi:hypothetical protein [Cloacibacillus porcorum]|jgi:hypothetical protein|uniref:Uncharacterized protein n=1 Tax=Cloacibacillus porcorum TaxID=1197717 RepID=A0A1B2I6H5_9BACT|nr:hypothetical protein [Cloacibacillus porcorum]ANZ45547.1 hypothetical protein BED41_10970 [Cloacibacillus porcorum]MCI5865186.1 hypothetical protein [Cloacibacillus porcorum]